MEITIPTGIGTLLLLAAIVLFVLAATRLGRGWMLPIGLACFAASALFGRS